MVIRRTDRVSSVLRKDGSLVEVFVAVSPAFERLRNPAMRRVMAGLVTVEQAARVAGVDPDLLVARLNGERDGVPPSEGRPGKERSEAGGAGADAPEAPSSPPPPSLPAMVHLDVREDLRAGREPFSRIMAARQEVPPGGGLCLRAPFEPVPLYGVMERFGFTHHAVQLGDEDWQVWFIPADLPVDGVPSPQGVGGDVAPDLRAAAGAPAATGPGRSTAPDLRAESPPPAAGSGGGNPAPGAEPEILDVRGLEPPEPMIRTLAALEALPPGGTLIQLNVRVPQFLLPRIEERGFVHEIQEQGPDLVRVVIRHRPVESDPMGPDPSPGE